MKNSKITTVIILILLAIAMFSCESKETETVVENNTVYGNPDVYFNDGYNYDSVINSRLIKPYKDTAHDLGVHTIKKHY